MNEYTWHLYCSCPPLCLIMTPLYILEVFNFQISLILEGLLLLDWGQGTTLPIMSESKRLNKRQARELQELEALGGSAAQAQGHGETGEHKDEQGEKGAVDEANEGVTAKAAPKASLFAQVRERERAHTLKRITDRWCLQ